jgi:hypothetical protein
MEVLTSLLDSLEQQRKQVVAALDEAKTLLREQLRVLELQEILTAITVDCGSEISYEYPDPKELGISLEDLDSEDTGIQARIASILESAGEDSEKRRGHIGLLLTTFGLSPEVVEDHRSSARKAGRIIVESMLRIQQIEDLRVALLGVDPHAEMSANEIARIFCSIGEKAPVAAEQSARTKNV